MRHHGAVVMATTTVVVKSYTDGVYTAANTFQPFALTACEIRIGETPTTRANSACDIGSTAEPALLFGKAFGQSPDHWLNL
jgi:hypothetical protein